MSCAILPLVKDYIKPLMILFKKELKDEYYMNDATKCLYTAVLVLSIYMGQYGIDHIKKCDVDYVQKYYSEIRQAARTRNPNTKFDPSFIFVENCRNRLFNTQNSQRYLYYVMVTNAEVPLKSDPTREVMQFPGHVCVIEKFPNGRFHLYQSYINNYDLKGHFDKSKGSFAISKDNLMKIFDAFADLYNPDIGVWSKKTTEAWQLFTHVGASEFEGREFVGKSFFCFRAIQIQTCASRLIRAIDRGLKRYKLDDVTRQELDQLKSKLG